MVHEIVSLVPRPPPFFVLRFSLTKALPCIMKTKEQKTGEAWERGYEIVIIITSIRDVEL